MISIHPLHDESNRSHQPCGGSDRGLQPRRRSIALTAIVDDVASLIRLNRDTDIVKRYLGPPFNADHRLPWGWGHLIANRWGQIT